MEISCRGGSGIKSWAVGDLGARVNLQSLPTTRGKEGRDRKFQHESQGTLSLGNRFPSLAAGGAFQKSPHNLTEDALMAPLSESAEAFRSAERATGGRPDIYFLL